MPVRTFRDLIAWQKAMHLTDQVYCLTRRLPTDERFGLSLQMRKAAVSIPSNIAEGFGRQSRPDLLYYLRIARGSLMELQTQLLICQRQKLATVSADLESLLQETDRVLQSLIRSLQQKDKETKRKRDEETK